MGTKGNSTPTDSGNSQRKGFRNTAQLRKKHKQVSEELKDANAKIAGMAAELGRAHAKGQGHQDQYVAVLHDLRNVEFQRQLLTVELTSLKSALTKSDRMDKLISIAWLCIGILTGLLV